VHYVEYRPHFCRLHPPPGWRCLTPITDSCRFELDELRHWPRDHVGRRPDPGRSRDAIAAQVQFRNHADWALGSRDVVLQDQHQIVHFWPRWGRSPFLSLHQFRQIFSSPTSPPSRQELLTVSPSVAPLCGATSYWLPFWVMGFNCREVHKRFSEDLPQRFLDRADEAFPVASHPRGSLRDEFPVDAVAYQLTLDSVHVHVSPELPQL
ncbi:hypothetical protein T05_10494, partial [Trichinella murrelli]